MATIKGTNGNDPNIMGTAGSDDMFGLKGNDALVGYGGNDTIEGGAGADQIFGSDGFDFASYKSSKQGVIIDLGTFGACSGGDAQGDELYGIEGLIGSKKADTLEGDSGVNELRGDKGNDRLDGNFGADTCVGGKGADLFVYDEEGDSYSINNYWDFIKDFKRSEGDKIDLSGLDGNRDLAGSQNFSFVGENALTGAAQVRFFNAGGDTTIEISTDGDVGAEMKIVLDGLFQLQASDFLL